MQVLNPSQALLAAHDKLLTARLLEGAGLPHPATVVATSHGTPERVVPGRREAEVRELGTRGRALRRRARAPRAPPAPPQDVWFEEQGVLVQELVEPVGFDLRLVVAAGRVVGAVRRVATAGEWRTNVALGGRRERVEPPAAAQVLALAAATVAGASLVGVDLLPKDEGWTILELNGAVDFTADYSLDGDVFAAVAGALAGRAAEAHARPAIARANGVDAG